MDNPSANPHRRMSSFNLQPRDSKRALLLDMTSLCSVLFETKTSRVKKGFNAKKPFSPDATTGTRILLLLGMNQSIFFSTRKQTLKQEYAKRNE
jgi:hypothetical protein